jgi:hypothetical protein
MRKRMMLAAGLSCCLGGAAAAIPLGSVVVYSDGTAEKLIARDAGELHWEDHRKRHLVRSTNPILPVLERREFLGDRGFSHQLRRGSPDDIQSSEAGGRVQFAVDRVRSDGSSSRREWECRYLGTEDRKVLGKVRRLENYSCERFKVHRKLWTKLFRERRTFSYSRDLGNVVEFERETRTRKHSRQLIGVFAPGKASDRKIRRLVEKAAKKRGSS